MTKRKLKQPRKGLWALLVKLVDIMHEEYQQRKALRVLARQKWSVEFLVYLLTKAAQVSKQNVSFALRNKDGQELVINVASPTTVDYAEQERMRANKAQEVSIYDKIDRLNAEARKQWEANGGFV